MCSISQEAIWRYKTFVELRDLQRGQLARLLWGELDVVLAQLRIRERSDFLRMNGVDLLAALFRTD